MKFLCLGYLDANAFDLVPAAEKEEILSRCFAQCERFRAAGNVVEEESLRPTHSAKSIRPLGGRPTVTDGPFLEVKEQLGSFFILEADSMEKAIEIASLHPAAIFGEEYGFGIEIRPIHEPF